MTTAVVGVGNLLMGDDGVGIHAAAALSTLALDAEIIDGGTATLDLLAPFLEFSRLFIVDAMRAGGNPGSLYRIRGCEASHDMLPAAHGMRVGDVLSMARMLGANPEVIFFGVEPRDVSPGTELSPEVKAALPRLVERIQKELTLTKGA